MSEIVLLRRTGLRPARHDNLDVLTHSQPLSLGSIPFAHRSPRVLTTDYGSSFNSCSVVWLTSYSSRVDSAMRG